MSLMFLQTWMKKSKTVGSIWPTSSLMAKRMASVINVGSGLPVLELGPGTGAITEAILATGLKPEKLFAVEYTKVFVDLLQLKFPEINLLHGDAFDLNKTLGNENQILFDCAISGLPLLNFPAAARIAFVEDILNRIPVGRPLVQFSYGPFAPISEKSGHFTVERFDITLRNIPPAQVWLYRRKTHS
jgi:phosphatidylethanolamine/phosphatidyl-N-methylethanolamine N-methyltransferase